MSWLSNTARAIGQALDITPVATLVHQIRTSLIGGEINIAEHKHQLANKELKAKRSRVQQGKQEQLLKTETSCVPIRIKKSLITGTQSATLAPQQSVTKPKRSIVQSTKADKLPKQEPLSAIKSVRGKQQATPVSKTHQRAKQVKKPKP